MKRSLLFVGMCLLLGLAAAGCGGGGSTTGGSAFAGTYIGNYLYNGVQRGVIAVQISSSGTITGREIDTTADTTTAITSGTINSTGTMSFTTLNGTASGIATLSSGQLSATLTSVSQNVVITLSSLPSTAGSAFGSFYSGTFTYNATTGPTAAMLIDSSGHITAWLNNTVTNNISIAAGTITSAGVTNLTSFGTAGAVNGTLAFNTSDKLTGTLTGASNTPTVVITLTPAS